MNAYPRKVFCWSKIGAEAGQDLDPILSRKEMERKANGGTFVWGIGNSIRPSIPIMLSEKNEPEAVFTPILSKARAEDRDAVELILWTSYVCPISGRIESLPKYSMVTSRGTTTGGIKARHYCLFCSSSTPINVAPELVVEGSGLVNARTLNPPGFSQVTSVVQRTGNNGKGRAKFYPVAFTANLVFPYHARLACPIPVNLDLLNEIKSGEFEKIRSVTRWRNRVKSLRARCS